MALSPSGKRLNHQRRIPKAALRHWTEALLARKGRIRNTTTFEELHELFASVANDVHGIGPLTIYDAATRVGAFLKLEPRRVFLHAGAREGAKALGFHRRRWLRPSELPTPFRRLRPDEIEDCLCIYKRHLRAAARRRPIEVNPRGCTDDAPC